MNNLALNYDCIHWFCNVYFLLFKQSPASKYTQNNDFALCLSFAVSYVCRLCFYSLTLYVNANICHSIMFCCSVLLNKPGFRQCMYVLPYYPIHHQPVHTHNLAHTIILLSTHWQHRSLTAKTPNPENFQFQNGVINQPILCAKCMYVRAAPHRPLYRAVARLLPIKTTHSTACKCCKLFATIFVYGLCFVVLWIGYFIILSFIFDSSAYVCWLCNANGHVYM